MIFAFAFSFKVDAATEVTNTDGGLYVVNCDEWISLRAFPDTGAAALTRIPLGDVVQVLDDSDGTAEFAHVTYRGFTGYALYYYLSPHATLYKVANCEEWISLRNAPYLTASVITRVPLGEYVRFVKHSLNGFDYVWYKGNLGFVLREYLE